MLGESLTNIPSDISNSKLCELLLEANRTQTEELKHEINSNIQEVSQKITAVDTRVTALQNKVLTLERKLRRNKVVIFGLEASEADILEHTIDRLREVLGVTIFKTDVNNIYLNSNTAEGKKSHVIVEFISNLKKQELFKNITKLKGSGITIVNDLCYEDRCDLKVLQKHLKNAKSQNHHAKIKGTKLEIDGKLYTLNDLNKLERQTLEESSEIETDGVEEERKTAQKTREKETLPLSKGREIKYNFHSERNLRSIRKNK